MSHKDGGCSSSMCGGRTSPLGMPPSSPISSTQQHHKLYPVPRLSRER
jgi:hypothetical protein